MDIKWETPPPASRGTAAVTDEEVKLADALVENPGEWARLRDFTAEQASRAGNLAASIRKGERAAFRPRPGTFGEFDAVSRRVPDTTITAVYVRWLQRPNA